MLGRFGGGLAILVFGFDFIWLGCKSNGADNAGNPVWGFLDGFVTFQEYVLGFAAAVGLAYAGWYVWNEFMSSRERDPGPLERTHLEYPRYDFKPDPQENLSPTPAQKVTAPEVSSTFESSFKSEQAQNKVLATTKPLPLKPKLTGKELKEKAIQELLGRY